MVDEPRLPSLASIRAFEAAARLGSFATAARELGSTAASVSYHVRQLEKQIGVALFHRFPHQVALTEPGRLIAAEATSAFAALRASFVRAAALDASALSLSALPTFGTSWLTPRLGGFRAAHPAIQVKLDLSPVARELGTGSYDAAIRCGFGGWPGLRAEALFPSLFLPLCAPHLRDEAERMLADPAAMAGPPLLGRHDWWRIWYRALGADAGFRDDRFGLELADEHLDAAAAVAGYGITIGSPILFADELRAGRLVPAHRLVAGDGRAFWFAYPIARQESAKIAAFRRWLREEAAAATAAAGRLIADAVVIPTRRDVPELSIMVDLPA